MEKINSDKAPDPVGAYPHAKKVGNLLFLSGVGPRKKGSKEIPGVTLDEQGNIKVMTSSSNAMRFLKM